MEKMGFPVKFISLIRLIDDAAVARVIINGALSEYITLDRGSRQGDPLSMSKFMIALNPLLVALNENRNIVKFKSFCNKEFLTLAKADDLTIVIGRSHSRFKKKSL